MRLVEKKCPNCGGALKFGFEDKETKCEFCGTSFEIERDEKVNKDKEEMFNADNYALTEEQKKAAKAIVGTFAAIQIVPILIFAVFFIGIVGFGIYNITKSEKEFKNRTEERKQEQQKWSEEQKETLSKASDDVLRAQGFIVEFEDLTDTQTKEIHDNTESILNNSLKGYKEFIPTYGKLEYVGMYLLKNDGSATYLYDVYKFKLGSDYYFTSVMYRNVKVINKKLVVDMSGSIQGGYNSGSGHKDGTYGYESDKDFFNKVIRGKLSSYRIITSGKVYNE